METVTPFVAYDVYRAECTRYGFVRNTRPDASSTASPYQMFLEDDELYMEFGEPVRAQHGLPESLSGLEGLAVEVHLHLWCSAWQSVEFYTENLQIGLCEKRAPEGAALTARNLPARKWRPDPLDGNPQLTDAYSKYPWGTGANPTVSASAEEVVVYSFQSTDPADVEAALRNAALCVRVAQGALPFNGSPSVNVLTGSGRAPYVEILYGTLKPTIWERTPGYNAYANPHQPIVLKWVYFYGYQIPGDTHRAFHQFVGGVEPPLEWSQVGLRVKDGEAVETIEVPGPAQELALPEAYYAGDFDWQLQIRVLGVTTTGDWFPVTIRDAIPTVRALHPKNEYLTVRDQAEFSWEYSIATGTAPTGYEIGALDGGEWRTLASGSESAATSATIPAGQLSSTISAWRVRACNVDGVYSEWSEAAEVILRVAPVVAELTVTGNTRPALSWQAADQQGWEAAVDGESAGVRYGAQKAFDWPEILDDGAHEVAVRVVNRFGLFSPWKSVRHEVRNVPPFAAGATAAVAAGCSVRVSWPASGAARVEIFRDGVRAAALEDGARSWTDQRGWTDHLTAGRHTYRVRLVDASGLYTDLVPAQAAPRLRRAVIAQEGVWDWVELGWIAGAEPPSRSSAYAPVYALQTYSGHALPVAEVSAHRTATHTLSYTVDGEDAGLLVQLVGQRAVFKRDGEVLRGLITGAQEVREWFGHTVTLTMAEVEDL